VPLDGGAEVVRKQALAAAPELGQAHVGGDRVQPGPGSAGVAQAGSAAPRAQQRLLQRIVGVVHRAEHPVAMGVELGSVLLDEFRETAIRRGHRQRCSTTISE
jgi:hypothetical protein